MGVSPDALPNDRCMLILGSLSQLNDKAWTSAVHVTVTKPAGATIGCRGCRSARRIGADGGEETRLVRQVRQGLHAVHSFFLFRLVAAFDCTEQSPCVYYGAAKPEFRRLRAASQH